MGGIVCLLNIWPRWEWYSESWQFTKVQIVLTFGYEISWAFEYYQVFSLNSSRSVLFRTYCWNIRPALVWRVVLVRPLFVISHSFPTSHHPAQAKRSFFLCSSFGTTGISNTYHNHSDVGVWAAEVWTAENDMSPNVDTFDLDCHLCLSVSICVYLCLSVLICAHLCHSSVPLIS